MVVDNKLIRILLWGGFLRFLFLLFILIVGDYSPLIPYIMTDDIAYETCAKEYLLYSNSVFDFQTASIIGIDGYLQIFWPYVMCISAKILGTIYAGRILNCVLSVICIKLIYDITHIISYSRSTALLASKLFAFLPYPVIICCFPLKDVFLTYAVFYIFRIFVRVEKHYNVKKFEIILSVFLSIAIFFTRGAVVEFLGILGAAYVTKNLWDNKRTLHLIVFFIFALVILSYFWVSVSMAAKSKIDSYNSDSYISSGMLRYIQINSISDIWKLPFTYMFAMLQPITLNFFSVHLDWSYVLRIMNISIYPIAFGNFLYIFMKKLDKLFWVSTFLMYSCVIALSLGIFRHYLFLFPLLVINYSCMKQMHYKNERPFVWGCSSILLLIILKMSL